MKPTLSTDEQVVLQVLTRAAHAQDRAPTNEQIAEYLGRSTPSTGAAIVRRLEAKGLIRVQRFNDSRVIEIVGTKHRTAKPAGDPKPHFRYRK